MNSVDMIAPKASENAVQSITSTKISQTWFASQTGPIAQSISARGRLPRSPPPADERPESRAEVGAAEDRVERHADPEHRRRRRPRCSRRLLAQLARAGARPVGHVRLSASAVRQRRAIARSTSAVAIPSAV